MSLLLTKLQDFLHRATNDRQLINQDTVKQFAVACSSALFNQFESYKQKKFTIRMSSIGRPLCQLQAEKYNLPKESREYNSITRNLWGDISEAYIMFLMRNAGIEIQSEQQKVTLKIGGIDLSGSYDVEIDGKIWDIKSASDFAFNNKFGDRGGFKKILEDDTFGYIPQLYLYSEATGKPVGGWIVLNKNSGVLTILEFPQYDKQYRLKALQDVEDKIISLTSDAPFKKCFKPIEEIYYQKKTGNMVLPMVCSFCQFKRHCWPDAEYLPSPVSTAKNKPWKFYTFISEE
jgi:hypothetical protein